jgi:hypothetical protein
MFKSLLKGVAVAALLFMPVSVHANSVKHQARLVDQHVKSLMRNAELATHAIGEMYKNGGLSDADFHAYLNDYLPMMPEVRAIVVVDENGVIAHDSFMLPAVPIDLSERAYVQGAKDLSGRGLYIGKINRGKTSGLPFLPISRAIYDDGRFAGVVSLVVTPNNLLRHTQWEDCQFCYVEVLRGDKTMLAQYPAGVERPEGYFDAIQLNETSASGRVRGVKFHEVHADVSWIRNDKYPYIVVYMDVQPSEVKAH